jgi:hypothetical protein
MRRIWLGLVGLTVLMLSCGDDPNPPPGPPKLRVGGSITGLAGSITLQLNGTESLTRSENGPFTFQSEFEDQSTFTVTITQVPAEQDCPVQGATGKLNGATVTSVKIVCTSHTYTLQGTVEGLTGSLQLRLGDETLSVPGSGPFTFQTRLPKGSTYAVSLVAQPKGHHCSVTNESGTVTGDVTGISVQCRPWFDLTHFQNATVVIGQSDFTSNLENRGGSPGPSTLAGPWGNPLLVDGKLYVSDNGNNRILGFNGLPSQNGAGAAFSLGQPDLTSSTPRSGRDGLSSPNSLSSNGTLLAAADGSNNRVLLFSTLPSSTATAPDLVLGQPDFTSATPRCDARSLSFPEGVFIGHGKLIVADTENNRVLIWNSIPSTSGASANLVLGQSSLTTCASNDTNGDGTVESIPTASTLSLPGGVWTDGTRLLVVDSSNYRVLLWKEFPTRNGQPADVVLGQPDFNTVAETTTAASLRGPRSVTSTGEQIFVAEEENHRVLVWNQFPTTNGAAADVVLGQPDFTSRNPGDPTPGTVPSARSLYQPTGIFLATPYVGVVDRGNNRLVIFESR